VSEDTYISADEDDDQSEDKYEDSFIDDQATPSGQFTQSEQGGEHTGDRMAFYRYYKMMMELFTLVFNGVPAYVIFLDHPVFSHFFCHQSAQLNTCALTV
jgi:hypothetical protein